MQRKTTRKQAVDLIGDGHALDAPVHRKLAAPIGNIGIRAFAQNGLHKCSRALQDGRGAATCQFPLGFGFIYSFVKFISVGRHEGTQEDIRAVLAPHVGVAARL